MRLYVMLTFVVLSMSVALADGPPAKSPAARKPAVSIHWESWSDEAFARARAGKRLVILDLEAVWCHWCHVMNETTYGDPEVAAIISKHFVALRVDQDSRPDLSNRYEDYGWPATVVFDSQGHELIKLSGFIPPRRLASMLNAVVDDPTPGPSVTEAPAVKLSGASLLSDAERTHLQELNLERYDDKLGGWGTDQKFLDPDSVEYAMLTGDARRARQTLDLTAQKLVDPVWGGVYQYSAEGDWDHPHFEKIMYVQGEDMRIFAQAYAQYGDPHYLQAARDIASFLTHFLMDPGGAFYTSQDADLVPGEHSAAYFAKDDAGRRKLGVPRIDRHIYARENGWAINAFATLYAVTGDRSALDTALRAATWIVAHRAIPDGPDEVGYAHGDHDAGGPYLGDTMTMGRTFLTLYEVTADRQWLTRARQAAAFIEHHFRAAVGYTTACTAGTLTDCEPQRDENVTLARFTNLLFHYTSDSHLQDMADHAMHYLADKDVAERFNTTGVLIADRETRSDPIHVTVVGRRDDETARALFEAALRQPLSYKQVEWLDFREGPLPGNNTPYPHLKRAAAYLCTSGRCSSPIYDAARIAEAMRPR